MTRSEMPQDETLGGGKGLDMGEEDKAEALFQELFYETQGRIGGVYIPGVVGFVKEKHRGIYETILNTEAEIEMSWLAMREGEDTLEKFREALKEWETAYLMAVELYLGQEKDEPKQGSLF